MYAWSTMPRYVVRLEATWSSAIAVASSSEAERMLTEGSFIHDAMPNSNSPALWLEQLDWIAVGIFDLDLTATRSFLQLVPEVHTTLLQLRYDR